MTSFAELQRCWACARAHFGNTTIVGLYNLTAAEKYNIFMVIVDESATEIVADPHSPPLTFDADIIADGAVPELGYLPFEMQIALPQSRTSRACPSFALRDVSILFTLHGGRPRNASRVYTPMTFSISGCGRDAQSLHNLSVSALGYANLQLSFVTLRDSHRITSIEQPGEVSSDAISFTESTILNSTLRYFGDVNGDSGQTLGLTQNGTRAVGARFLAVDPHDHLPGYVHRPAGHCYQFGWYGSYPEEWGNATRGFAHLEDSYVQYLCDVQLGSVNVSRTTIDGWWSKANPTFAPWAINSTALPPSIKFYNMEMVRAEPGVARTTFGCNLSDSTIRYAWDVEILRSAVRNTSFIWSADGLGPFPASWAKSPPVNPSFWVDLRTYQAEAGFVQSVNDSLMCMRPSVEAAAGVRVGEQVQTVANGSVLFNTQFWHTTDAQCTGAGSSARGSPAANVVLV